MPQGVRPRRFFFAGAVNPVVEKTMPTQSHDEPDRNTEKQQREQLDKKIGGHVIDKLGQPTEPHGVQIRRLWKDHYRVNVFVGLTGSATVAHSYFLVADGEGNILGSTPTIIRQYRPLDFSTHEPGV
jgi:hypothetical protein